MSLSAPPCCSLFVPVPGSAQLALVKKELRLWNAFFFLAEQVNLLPISFTYSTLLLFLSHPVLISLPSPLPLTSEVFPCICMQLGRAQAWHFPSEVQSIREQSSVYRAALHASQQHLAVLAVRGNTGDVWNEQGTINCGTGPGIYHS